jgi:Na+-transporting NADH:ubiquinone oxidoreductase subunit C
MQRESVLNTFVVATCLCVVCSVIVSASAVFLRPAQEANKVREVRKNILMAAGLYQADKPLDELFQQVEPRLVNLETGQYASPSEVDSETYNQREAAASPEQSIALDEAADSAGIKRRENYAFVYLIKQDGQLDQVILPIRGKGLWSTLYGFLALDGDMRTIRGITFYEHGETPGLGGEVDNPKWKAQWEGKLAFDEQGDVAIEVIRGQVDPEQEGSFSMIDGLTGATITARGVSDLVQFWLGENGFGPYLEKQRTS